MDPEIRRLAEALVKETKEQTQMLSDIRADQKHYNKVVEEHHRTLYGNGAPGLKEDVSGLVKWKAENTDIGKHVAGLIQWQKSRIWIERSLIGAAALTVMSGVGVAIVWLIREMAKRP